MFLRPCVQCGKEFDARQRNPSRRYCSMACSGMAHRKRAEQTCMGCGTSFVARTSEIDRGGGKYCSRTCWIKYLDPPALRPGVADKIAVAKTKTGKQAGRRTRQLQNAGMTLQAKGETSCRNCGQTDHLQLHHVIPRSMWRRGILELLNGVPLCVRCHMGWHHHRVVIYRDIFTAEEWAFLTSADLLGQEVSAWLDKRYPSRPNSVQ
jgi:hypothetical protein